MYKTWVDLLDFDEKLYKKFISQNKKGSYGRFLIECGLVYLNAAGDCNCDTAILLFKLVLIHFSASDPIVQPFITKLADLHVENMDAFVHVWGT